MILAQLHRHIQRHILLCRRVGAQCFYQTCFQPKTRLVWLDRHGGGIYIIPFYQLLRRACPFDKRSGGYLHLFG